MIVPTMNTASARKSRVVTALSSGPYMPRRTRMNEPEMPGRIMAQMAIAPARKKAHNWGSRSCPTVSSDVPPRSPRAMNVMTPTPMAIQMCFVSRLLSIAQATTIEPATSPMNSAAIRTACSSSRCWRTLARATTARRIPVPSGTMNSQSTLPIHRLKPAMSSFTRLPSAEEPARTDSMSRS